MCLGFFLTSGFHQSNTDACLSQWQNCNISSWFTHPNQLAQSAQLEFLECSVYLPNKQCRLLIFRLSMVRGRAFPVAGAKVWNTVPLDVTSASSRLVATSFQDQTENWHILQLLWLGYHVLPLSTVVIATVLIVRPQKKFHDDDNDTFSCPSAVSLSIITNLICSGLLLYRTAERTTSVP